MKKYLKRTFLLLPVAFVCFLFLSAKPQGRLIVLYGTPCAGKSTLAAALAEELPGTFKIFKKTKIVEEKRKEYLLALNGRKPETHEQIVEEILALPEEQKLAGLSFSTEGLESAMQEIKQRVKNGENIIFDVCLSHPAPLDALESAAPLKVLVYAPLTELSARTRERARVKNQSALFSQRRRKSILAMFSRLYHPIRQSSDKPPIDLLNRADLEAYYAPVANELVFDELEHEVETAYSRFRLDKYQFTAITPRVAPDVLINTKTQSVADSVAIVAEAALQPKQKHPPRHTPEPLRTLQNSEPPATRETATAQSS